METPSQEIFDECKKVAIEIWSTYDDKYGYATEKINRINSINNKKDNVMIFYRMFDFNNKKTMKSKLSKEALDYINNND